MRIRDEIVVQAKAIEFLHPVRNEVTNWIVDHFAPCWRGIIEDFEQRFQRVPSPQELIWCLGVVLGHDPRVDVRKMNEACNCRDCCPANQRRNENVVDDKY